MISTKEQILGAPQENTQSTVAEVAAPPVQRPVPNGGTAPTGNDGSAAPVNDGSAIVGAAKTVQGGAAPATATTTPATTTTPPASTAPAGTETTKKAPLPTTQTAPAGTATATPGPTTEPAKAAEPKRMSYVEMFQQMSPYKPPTPEELEKERKREKREKVFAAIGDGIAALSNLYFTTKGAPNAFDPRNSLSEKARERWDKLNKEREENGRYYMQEAMKAQALDDDRDDKDRSYMSKLQNDYRNYLLKLSADNRAAELHDLDKQLRQGKINEQTYKAKKAEVEAKYAEATQKSVIAKNKASAKASNASAANSYASAEEHRRNVNSGYAWYEKDGTRHIAKTKDEAVYNARQHGTLDSVETISTDTTKSDVVYKGKVVKNQKKTVSTKHKKNVYYPGIRQKPAAKPQVKPAAKPSGGSSGSGKYSGFSIYK